MGLKLEAALKAELEGEVRFDRISRALYATDASVYQVMPLGVVIPRTREDVVRTVRLCREHGVSITARGGGTSQAGQAIGAGVQLDFAKYLNNLVEINAAEQWVRVEPGIVLDELNALLKPHGLQLPLDISTSDRATIGGMIANNSAGTRSVLYGKTLDYVLSLEVVLANGETVALEDGCSGVQVFGCSGRRPTTDDRPPDRPEHLNTRTPERLLQAICRIAAEHREEIERRYPRILRRVGGYNLDEFVEGRSGVRAFRRSGVDRHLSDPSHSSHPSDAPNARTPERPFNLSRLIVGSEGTLAVVVEAKLRVVPLPAARALCVVQFHDLLRALATTPVILEHGPSAVELLDRFILDSTRGTLEFAPLRDFIVGDPAAVLVVEFFGEDVAELPARLDALEGDLRSRGLGYHFHRALAPAAQARIWKLRRAALGLSMSERGDAKAISFVEDTAVAPERLRDYIERFLQILQENDTHAGFYAHASVGLLHVRPVVNLKTADGVARFVRIAEQIADLVLEFGGALSGEHGDGLVRAPFQEKMFGPALYQAFREVKRMFDPANLFNPGKIVDAPPLTGNLRFGPGYQTAAVETTLDFTDFGGLAGAAEQCGGIGECRKKLAGTMCPSYAATRDEADSTRGRANALRLAISGQLGPDGLADPALYPVLDLCLECKACKTECPTGVDMARIKAEFLHQYHRVHGAPLRSRLLAHPDRLAEWGSRFAPIANPLLASAPARWLAEKLIGIDRRRVPPAFARQTLLQRARLPLATEGREGTEGTGPDKRKTRNGITGRPGSSPSRPALSVSSVPSAANPVPDQARIVAIFPDTFTNYYEPEIGIAAAQLAAMAGAQVVIAPRVCCGRPLISKGLLDEARLRAEASVQALLPLARQGTPIVFLEPSCYSAVRDEHPLLLRGVRKQEAQRVAEVCVTFEEWAARAFGVSEGGGQAGSAGFRAGPRGVLLHGHCHQKALVGTVPAVRLLSAIPGCEVTDLDGGCCGMAGSFGYEREHYEVSRRVGEHRLLPAVRAAPPGTAVVASGFSCRHQIRHFAGVEAVHPAVLMRSLLDV